MGNLCSKSDKDDGFSTPGRVLGSAPPQPQRASVPATKVVGGPPRTLGGTEPGAGSDSASPDEARMRAAEAAEARAKAAAKSSGKLSSQLQAQKKQTRQDTLKEISRDERRARDADEAAQARTHN